MAHSVVTVDVRSLSRLPSTRSGNPRFGLTTDAGEYDTAPDAEIGYSLENITGPAGSRLPLVLRLTLDHHGRVTDVERSYGPVRDAAR